MVQGSGSGRLNPARISTSIKSVITNQQEKLGTETHPRVPAPRNPDHGVADLFGRCFLRFCYWIDVVSSMARRGEPPAYVPFPRQRAASLTASEPAKHLMETDSAATVSRTPIASA
jgi:hypothetical protein